MNRNLTKIKILHDSLPLARGDESHGDRDAWYTK